MRFQAEFACCAACNFSKVPSGRVQRTPGTSYHWRRGRGRCCPPSSLRRPPCLLPRSHRWWLIWSHRLATTGECCVYSATQEMPGFFPRWLKMPNPLPKKKCQNLKSHLPSPEKFKCQAVWITVDEILNKILKLFDAEMLLKNASCVKSGIEKCQLATVPECVPIQAEEEDLAWEMRGGGREGREARKEDQPTIHSREATFSLKTTTTKNHFPDQTRLLQ